MYGSEQREKDIQEKIDKVLTLLKDNDAEIDTEDDTLRREKLTRHKEKLYARWMGYEEELKRLAEKKKELTASSTHKKGDNKNGGRTQPNKQSTSPHGLTPESLAVIASVLIQMAKHLSASEDSE